MISPLRTRPAVRSAGGATAVSDLLVFLLIVVVIVGAATGSPRVASLGGLAFVVAVVSRLWSRLSLEEVYCSRTPSQHHLFVGDEFEVLWTLENRKPLPVPWVRMQDVVPGGLQVVDEEMESRPYLGGTEVEEITGLGRYERVRIRHTIKAARRGVYRLGPAEFRSGDLFGLYGSRKEMPQTDWTVTVYPRTVPLPGFQLPMARPIGDALTRTRLWADPTRPNGVREYMPGDPLRSVDWKTTARRNALYVRTYDPSVSQYLIVLLEAVTTEVPWEGYRADVLEASVTGAASIAMHGIELGHRVGLVCNGVPPGERERTVLAPGAGAGQLQLILEALAGVRPMAVWTLERLIEGRGAGALPYGATIAYVAGRFVPNTAGYVAGLANRGFRVMAFYTGDGETPRMPGVRVTDARDMCMPPEQDAQADPDARFRRPPGNVEAALEGA